jgi:hypothetical protein
LLVLFQVAAEEGVLRTSGFTPVDGVGCNASRNASANAESLSSLGHRSPIFSGASATSAGVAEA